MYKRQVLAGAPGITPEYYEKYVGQANVKIIFGQTYRIDVYKRQG